MLKHSVHTVTTANATPSLSSTAGVATYSDTHPCLQTSAEYCAGTQQIVNAGTGSFNSFQYDTRLDNANNSGAHVTQVIDSPNYSSQQTVHGRENYECQDQPCIPDTLLLPSSSKNVVHFNSDNQHLIVNSPAIGQTSEFTSAIAKENVHLTTEKGDSSDKLSKRSPLASPSSRGGKFSFAGVIMSQKFQEGVTEQDLLQVESFYRSHKSEVYVCGCLANMYFGPESASQWVFSSTGIPLLVLNTGEHHRERKLYIILAEKGTGFTMWRDVIDSHTDYQTPNENFHTLRTSKDHSKLAGFSFDDPTAASKFCGHIHKLTADPDDDLLKIGKFKKKKSIKDKKKKVKLPKKTEISQPCCFVHVTKLEPPTIEESETSSPTADSNTKEISAPFDFQHLTDPARTGSNLLNLAGSKLTLTSTGSMDSGLSDDRGSAK